MPRASFQSLVGRKQFLFFFMPEDVEGFSEEFVTKFIRQVLPTISPSDLSWIIYPVPGGTEAQQRTAMGKVIASWLAEQGRPDAVRFDQKIGTFSTNVNSEVQVTCLIAYLYSEV